MQDWAIVTGGGTGIGRELALALAARGLHVLIAGRREQPLRETQAEAPERVHIVSADLATESGRRAVVAALPVDARLRCLVHNAALLTPIGPLAEVSLEEWRLSQATNVEAPLFLTQALLNRLRGGRSLHISSGAAHHSYRSWGAYCSSKAVLYMLYLVLREELREYDIAVGSVRPGVVDTPMQTLIRSQTADRFPDVGRFQELKRAGQLVDPKELAQFLAWLLLDVPADEFSAQEWNFTDPEHRARWGG